MSEDEIVRGRRAPFTQVADWVLVSPATVQARLLYAMLAAHVNVVDGRRGVWPSRSSLAKLLGFAKTSSVDRYIDELVELGAIDVHPRYRPDGGRSGNLYVVHELPPDDAASPATLPEWYASRPQSLPADTPQSPPGEGGSPFQGTRVAPSKGRAQSAGGGRNYTKENKTKENETNGKATAPPGEPARRPRKTRQTKQRTPQEQARYEEASAIATAWWERCKDLGIPNPKRGNGPTTGFPGLVGMLERFLADGCTGTELRHALDHTRQPFPPVTVLTSAVDGYRNHVRARPPKPDSNLHREHTNGLGDVFS
ncbi:hypothetical protein GCM10022221_68490 [Actinocorallia aurea]